MYRVPIPGILKTKSCPCSYKEHFPIHFCVRTWTFWKLHAFDNKKNIVEFEKRKEDEMKQIFQFFFHAWKLTHPWYALFC